MTAKKCDRCGKYYDPEEEVNKILPNTTSWRYGVIYDAHPYPEIKKDLCLDCRISLNYWMNNQK